MIYETTNVLFVKGLQNLLACLDKAAAFADHKKIEFDVLLQSRLAPDQFALTRQIQITCDTAKLGASRLTGKPAPSHADDEKTLADVRARIQSTIDYLQSFKFEDYQNAKTQKVSQPRWEGKYLTGEEYVLHHMIPNFYFHETTAYSILRHNGVEVGKKDFLGAMPYKQ